MDEAFRNFEHPAIGPQHTTPARTSTALRYGDTDIGPHDDEELTEVEEAYETASESMSPQKYIQSLTSIRQYQTSSSRKRTSADFSKEQGSRKRVLHRSETTPAPLNSSPSGHKKVPIPTAHSFTTPTSRASGVFDPNSSHRTSLKTDATSFSFGKRSHKDRDTKNDKEYALSPSSKRDSDSFTKIAICEPEQSPIALIQPSDTKALPSKASFATTKKSQARQHSRSAFGIKVQ